jgi:hypothetical protein
MLEIPREERQAEPAGSRCNQAVDHVNVMAELETQGPLDCPVKVLRQEINTLEAPQKLDGSPLSPGVRGSFEDLQPDDRRDAQTFLRFQPVQGGREGTEDIDDDGGIQDTVH